MSKRFGKIALIQGGDSPEREISLASAKMVGVQLDQLCTEVLRFDPRDRELCELTTAGVDAAFIILHGGIGEDGRVQAALELLGIPYTGPRHFGCAMAMDKNVSKLMWTDVELPTPPWLLVTDTNEETLDEIQLNLGLELFVKPNNGGSSLATAKVNNRDELATAILAALATDPKAIVEQAIGGMELTYGIVGDEVLPGIRIEVANGFYDYAAKYDLDTTKYICPPQIPAEVDAACRELSMKAFTALDCSGWGRVDLMVSGREPFLLEVNPVPGMTDHSLVPKAATVAGIAADELVARILELAQ